MEEKKTNNSLFAIGINLMIVCLISGLIIASVYTVTAPVAAQQRVIAQQKAMQELLPDAQDFKKIEGKEGWYAGMKDGKVVGYVLPAEGRGYGGTIKMLVSATPEAKVISYKILSHNETPGLGDKATQPKFISQFKGKGSEDLVVVKTQTDKNIQALTGATITSRGVTNAVKKSIDELQEYVKSHQE